MRSNGSPRYNKLGAVTDDSENPNPNGDYPNANSNYNADSKNPDPDEKISDTCAIVVVVFFIFEIGSTVAYSVWDSYHPDFPDFSVSRFEVSDFNLSSNSLTSDFNVSIAIRNPNKRASIGYEDVKAAVLYSTGDVDSTVLDTNDFVIAKTPMFPFSQGPKNVTDLKARMATVGFHVNDEDTIRSGDGDLRFGVRVSLTVGFKGARIPEYYYKLKVYCDGIRVGLKNSTAVAGVGSMVGPARGCRTFRKGLPIN